jgi:hypothetical protein
MLNAHFSRKEAAAFLKISLSTFDRTVKMNADYLQPILIGRRFFYLSEPLMNHCQVKKSSSIIPV